MDFRDRLFGYSDLLECLELLRRRTDTRLIAELIALIGQYVLEVDVKAALRYLRWKGRIKRQGGSGPPAFDLVGTRGTDATIAEKVRKSAVDWDGTWTVLTYDVPENRSAARRQLRRLLRRMGFAMLSKSSWVSPYDWRAALQDAVLEWDSGGTFSYIRSADVSALGDRMELVADELWGLDGARDEYGRIVRVARNAPKDNTQRSQAARARALMIATKAWQWVQEHDPMLPRELLPRAWPREQADRLLGELAGRVARDAQKLL